MRTRIDAMPFQRLVSQQAVPGIVELKHFPGVNFLQPRSGFCILQTDDERRGPARMMDAFEETKQKRRSPQAVVLEPVNEEQ